MNRISGQRAGLFEHLFGESLYSYLRAPTRFLRDHRAQIAALIHMSAELQQKGFSQVFSGPKFIYVLAACGQQYVGNTGDPIRRLLDHIGVSDGASAVLVEKAAETWATPRMEIVDITDEGSVLGIEAYWIHRYDGAVNDLKNKEQYEAFVASPAMYKSAVANEMLGWPAQIDFKPSPFTLIPPWLATK